MLTISNLNITIILELLVPFFDFIESNSWVNFGCEIIISSIIVLMAGRSTDKILKGLQGTASATVIAKGAIDAYKAWESSNNDDEDNIKENKDKKDEVKSEDKKEEAKSEDSKDEIKKDKNNKTNEK